MSNQKIWILLIGLLLIVLLGVAGRALATDTGTTTLISRHTDGTIGDGQSFVSDISPGGGYGVSLFWHGPDNGFNLNIGGLEMD